MTTSRTCLANYDGRLRMYRAAGETLGLARGRCGEYGAVMRRMMLRAATVGAALLLAGCGGSAPSTVSAVNSAARAAGLRLVRIGVFRSPTYLAGAPGDRRRVFVVEKSGTIVVLAGRRRQPFLDISSKVSSSGEQGLLSMAFAPDYARSRRFFVYYTDHANNLRIVAYRRSRRDPDRADPRSARGILTIDHHTETNHNGGQLQFGPDGDLYAGIGDGGSEGDPLDHGQNTDTLLGKLLRIRPRAGGGYAIPKGNPFAGVRGKRPEIWAYGLRNPWRFSFDRLTGDLAIGDVGQDREEEIDFARRGSGAGANYGWRVWEGDLRYQPGSAPGAVAPAIVADHSDGYCAIIGGYVVRDPALPALDGRYLYGDDCKPAISSARLGTGHATGSRPTGLSVSELAAFGQDSRGRIYAVSLAGSVYRIAER